MLGKIYMGVVACIGRVTVYTHHYFLPLSGGLLMGNL